MVCCPHGSIQRASLWLFSFSLFFIYTSVFPINTISYVLMLPSTPPLSHKCTICAWKKKWILLFLGFFSIVVHYINFVSHVYQVLYILTDFFVCLICESQREALKNLSWWGTGKFFLVLSRFAVYTLKLCYI